MTTFAWCSKYMTIINYMYTCIELHVIAHLLISRRCVPSPFKNDYRSVHTPTHPSRENGYVQYRWFPFTESWLHIVISPFYNQVNHIWWGGGYYKIASFSCWALGLHVQWEKNCYTSLALNSWYIIRKDESIILSFKSSLGFFKPYIFF